MRDFFFHAPGSLKESLSLLDEHGDDARLMSGGTAMMLIMKQSLLEANHVVSLHRVPGLDYINRDNGMLRIGALTKHRSVETSSDVKAANPLLAEVYSRIATIRIRNVGTVGGGLAHSDPAQDPQPALLALGASVKITSGKGEREIALSDFLVDYYETALEPGEVITELIVPDVPDGAKGVYIKYLPRTADDYPTVGVAAIGVVKEGVCEDVRLGLGALAPTALRATSVEDALKGKQVNAQVVRQAAEAVAELVDPLDDPRGSAEYKRDMSVVFARRALEQALGLA
jgi:carbon-monoxide dehydrogenase medium subunit